jgi:hypothetical protein
MKERRGLYKVKKTCRNLECRYGPFTPTFEFGFHEDNVGGPGTGLCERCFALEIAKPNDGIKIPEEFLSLKCKIGSGSLTCRFLSFSETFKCTKKSTKQSPINLKAKGDNCSGPPQFWTRRSES